MELNGAESAVFRYFALLQNVSSLRSFLRHDRRLSIMQHFGHENKCLSPLLVGRRSILGGISFLLRSDCVQVNQEKTIYYVQQQVFLRLSIQLSNSRKSKAFILTQALTNSSY